MRTGRIELSVEKSTRSLLNDHQRGRTDPDGPGDGLGVAVPDPGDLPKVAFGRDGLAVSGEEVIEHDDVNSHLPQPCVPIWEQWNGQP